MIVVVCLSLCVWLVLLFLFAVYVCLYSCGSVMCCLWLVVLLVSLWLVMFNVFTLLLIPMVNSVVDVIIYLV